MGIDEDADWLFCAEASLIGGGAVRLINTFRVRYEPKSIKVGVYAYLREFGCQDLGQRRNKGSL